MINQREHAGGRAPVLRLMAAMVATILLAGCATAASDHPLTLLDADLMPGVDQRPAGRSAAADSGAQTGEGQSATWVFRIRLRNESETPLRNIETWLVAPNAIKNFYGGADPFSAEGGKRTNYGNLGLDLAPGDEIEIKRSIIVIPNLPDSNGDDDDLPPDDIARFIAVRDVADQAVLEILYNGGGQRFDLSGRLGPKDWPPFTMVYEMEDGQSVMVGDRLAAPRQLRRFEYQSATQWVDTVLESAPIETRVGTFSQIGSYRRLDGRKLVEYDSVAKSTGEDEIDEGVRYLARGFFIPYRNRHLEESQGITPVKVATASRVCFRNECEDNATGLLYRLDSGYESVFADDSRGFPLRLGTSFLVKELHVDDEQK